MSKIQNFIATLFMTPEQAQKERHHREKMMMEEASIRAKIEIAHISGQYAHEIEVERGIAKDRNTRIAIACEDMAKRRQMVLGADLDIIKMLVKNELDKNFETHKHNLKMSEKNAISEDDVRKILQDRLSYRPDDDY